MYEPHLKKKHNGLPVVSRQELDVIGENLVRDFYPEAARYPIAIDIEQLAQDYLKLDQDFKYLSNNGIYLGMMVFNDTNKVPVYDPISKRAEYINVKAGTIIIDQNLLEEGQEHRLRYTMGHEVSHAVLHKQYFTNIQNQTNNKMPLTQCRVDSAKLLRKPTYLWTDNDWMEWHADRLSSSILMPASTVKMLSHEQMKGQSAFAAACLILQVTKIYNVSVMAARIRLKELGIISTFKDADINFELSLFMKV